MSENRQKIICSRLAKAEEAQKMAEFAIENNYWNSAASELYYTCFYLITALFEKNNITVHTHSGAKTLLALHFVKEGKIELRWGKLFSDLFNRRQTGDYHDLVFLTEEEILPFVSEVEEFKQVILRLINE
jgi:uncharacterized protein (UPF0332 family)